MALKVVATTASFNGLFAFAGDNVAESHCYKGIVAQKPRNLTEKTSQESQSVTTDLSDCRADDQCSIVQVKGKKPLLLNNSKGLALTCEESEPTVIVAQKERYCF